MFCSSLKLRTYGFSEALIVTPTTLSLNTPIQGANSVINFHCMSCLAIIFSLVTTYLQALPGISMPGHKLTKTKKNFFGGRIFETPG